MRARTKTLFGLLTVLAGATFGADLKHPDWHPGNDLLVAEGSCSGSVDIYLVQISSNRVWRVYDGGATEGYPRWFPSGDQIVFHRIDEDRNATLMTARLEATGEISSVEQITEGPFDIEPAPSPDGTRIAYSQAGEGGQDIVVMGLSTGGERRVWETTTGENFPSWHPHGQAIIFHRRDSEQTQIHQLDLHSGATRLLTTAPGPNRVGHLGPRAESLAYSSERDQDREIYLLDVRRGSDKRLTRRAGRDGYPKIAPDGIRLAYHAQLEGGQTVIRVLHLQTGETQEFSCE